MGYNTYTPAPHEFAERAPATRLARHLEPRARSPPARERRVQNGSASGSGACTGPARTREYRQLGHPRQKISLPALIKFPAAFVSNAVVLLFHSTASLGAPASFGAATGVGRGAGRVGSANRR